MTIAFVFCALCILILYILLRQRRKQYVMPPEMSGKLPVIGHAYELLRITEKDGPWGFLKKVSEEALQKGGVMTVSLGPKISYVIADPEDFLTLMNQCLEKDHFVYDFVKAWFGNGLATTNGRTWKTHYKILSPAFSQKSLNEFINIFNETCRSFVIKLATKEGEKPFDQTNPIKAHSVESICKTAFGVDIKEHPLLVEKFTRGVNESLWLMTERFKRIWLHNNIIYNLSTFKRKFDRAIADIQGLIDFVINKRRAYLESKSDLATKDNFTPLLDAILEIAAPKGIYTENDIRDEANTIVTAGSDTVSTQMTIVLTLLGSYQNVQQKIYEEIQEVFKSSDSDVTKQDLPKLVYTEAVLKEAIRLYPIIPFVARYTYENVKLKNYTIPAGSRCFLSIYGANHHEVWGSDADKFKPERWLNSNTRKNKSNALVGFSVGRRSCLGQQYAMMSMKIMVVHLLRQYRIKSDISNMKINLAVIAIPESGHEITIERRK